VLRLLTSCITKDKKKITGKPAREPLVFIAQTLIISGFDKSGGFGYG
jgi:hypothetical protein